MYAPVSPGASPAKRGIWPLAAICCLGLLGFLIVITIVLALIPIYLPSKSVSVTSAPNNTFFLQYEAEGNDTSNATGTTEDNTALGTSLNNALGLDDDFTVESGNVQTAFTRERRSLFGLGKTKRAIKIKSLFTCKTKIKASCISPTCRNAILTRIQVAVKKVTTISNLRITVRSRQLGVKEYPLSLKFVGLLSARPLGFAGEPKTLGQFIAISSGDFADPLVWQDGIVPYGVASIIVSAGVTVSITTSAMELKIKKCDVYGSLVLGTSSVSSFTFQQAIQIVVYKGGKLEDQTSGGQIYTRINSLLQIHPGGSCVGPNTKITSFSTLPATNSLGATLTIGPSFSGPFTCGILSNTVIKSFKKVTYIASQSGEFSTETPWCGSVVPSADICDLVGGCDMYIANGCTLSTTDLNNQLNINFKTITVDKGAILQLGSIGVPGGFTFKFPCGLTVLEGGNCQDKTSNKQLYFPPKSAFTCHPGGSFTGPDTKIYTYSSLPAANSLGAFLTIPSSISGALTIALISTTIVQSFPKIIYVAAQSGSIISDDTYCNGEAPTADICATTGCELYIAPGCTLTTVGTNNQLDINIKTITVGNGGKCQLGESGVTGGFTFKFRVGITVLSGGSCEDKTSNKQLYFPPKSAFTCHPGGSFTGPDTKIYAYSSLPAANSLGAFLTIPSSISGALTIALISTTIVQSFPKVIYVAVQSGSIISDDTYCNGEAPTTDICATTGCELYIAPGCTLTTVGTNNQLDINIKTITVANGGKCQLGQSDVSGGFTFKFRVGFTVEAGGQIIDVTPAKQIYCLAGSVFTFYGPQAFVGSNTDVKIYTTLPATGSVTSTFTLGSSFSGPFTLAALLDGQFKSFSKVTFIALFSGSFLSADTWCGGVVPTADVCASLGGCGLYVAPGCTLSMADLNGKLDINFNTITIAAGAKLEIGTSGVSTGFKFGFAVNIEVYGILSDVCGCTGGIRIPKGSRLYFYPGGSFLSIVTTKLIVYDPFDINFVGLEITLVSGLTGPFFIIISITGQISAGTALPEEMTTVRPAIETTGFGGFTGEGLL